MDNRFRRSLKLSLCCAALTGTFFAASPARASEVFPEVIQNHWKFSHRIPVPGAKGCRLCHSDEVGGDLNVNQTFGRRIKDTYKVTEKKTAALQAALDDIRTKGYSFDEDEVSDYLEIVVDKTNPNDKNDFVVHQVPSDGGAAGASGQGEGNQGGDTGVTPPTPPPLPALDELPPPIGHGCSIARPSRASLGYGAGVFVALGLWLRRRATRRAR